PQEGPFLQLRADRTGWPPAHHRRAERRRPDPLSPIRPGVARRRPLQDEKPSRMKTLLQQGAALLLALSGLAAPAYAEQENAADETAPCTDLQCLICPQLNDPAPHASGRMKLLATLTPGKDNWLFRSMVDMSNQFGIPKHMEPEFKRFMDTFKAKGINV